MAVNRALIRMALGLRTATAFRVSPTHSPHPGWRLCMGGLTSEANAAHPSLEKLWRIGPGFGGSFWIATKHLVPLWRRDLVAAKEKQE